MSNERWIRTDEAEDVAGSIRHAIRCFDYVTEDEQAWKWMLLALHSALQGACVCHLVTSATPIGIVSEKNASQWIAYREAQRCDPNAVRPRTYVMPLPNLLNAARAPHSAGDRRNADGISISDEESAWLKLLHDEIRNQFVHFEPMGWSLEVSGLPSFAKIVAQIIGEISAVGYAFRHQDGEWTEALRSDLVFLRSFA